MTLAEIKASDKMWLTPDEIAPVIGAHAQSIRAAARQKPELLGFPVTVVGTRTRIPRKPFLQFLGEADG